MRAKELTLNEMRDAADLAVTVAAAAVAGLFDGLAAGAETPAELAGRLGLDARAVGIVLPVLEELGLVEARDGAYALTDAGRRRFVDRGGPEYVGGGLALWLENLAAWARLPEVLRTGRPSLLPARDRDPEALAAFMAGMAAQPAERVRRVVEACLDRCPGARSALDLGGGPGLFAREFVRAGLEVTLLDRPEVVEFVAGAYGLDDVSGLRLEAGDFHVDPLPEGPFDVVLLSNITHAYSPEENRELLRRVARVLAPGGVVAIGDFVRGRSPRAALFAIVMLLRTEGGDTYGEAEYRAWLEETGFRDVRVEDVDVDRQLVTAQRAPED